MPNYDRAKLEAQKIIEQYGIVEPAVPVFDLAEQLGYHVVFFSSEGELSQVAGVTKPESRTIYVNQADPVYRQSFTVAHELGHIVMKHDPNSYGVYLRNTHVETDDVEKKPMLLQQIC